MKRRVTSSLLVLTLSAGSPACLDKTAKKPSSLTPPRAVKTAAVTSANDAQAKLLEEERVKLEALAEKMKGAASDYLKNDAVISAPADDNSQEFNNTVKDIANADKGTLASNLGSQNTNQIYEDTVANFNPGDNSQHVAAGGDDGGVETQNTGGVGVDGEEDAPAEEGSNKNVMIALGAAVVMTIAAGIMVCRASVPEWDQKIGEIEKTKGTTAGFMDKVSAFNEAHPKTAKLAAVLLAGGAAAVLYAGYKSFSLASGGTSGAAAPTPPPPAAPKTVAEARQVFAGVLGETMMEAYAISQAQEVRGVTQDGLGLGTCGSDNAQAADVAAKSKKLQDEIAEIEKVPVASRKPEQVQALAAKQDELKKLQVQAAGPNGQAVADLEKRIKDQEEAAQAAVKKEEELQKQLKQLTEEKAAGKSVADADVAKLRKDLKEAEEMAASMTKSIDTLDALKKNILPEYYGGKPWKKVGDKMVFDIEQPFPRGTAAKQGEVVNMFVQDSPKGGLQVAGQLVKSGKANGALQIRDAQAVAFVNFPKSPVKSISAANIKSSKDGDILVELSSDTQGVRFYGVTENGVKPTLYVEKDLSHSSWISPDTNIYKNPGDRDLLLDIIDGAKTKSRDKVVYDDDELDALATDAIYGLKVKKLASGETELSYTNTGGTPTKAKLIPADAEKAPFYFVSGQTYKGVPVGKYFQMNKGKIRTIGIGNDGVAVDITDLPDLIAPAVGGKTRMVGQRDDNWKNKTFAFLDDDGNYKIAKGNHGAGELEVVPHPAALADSYKKISIEVK